MKSRLLTPNELKPLAEKIASAYLAGESSASLCRRFKASPKAINKLLRDCGAMASKNYEFRLYPTPNQIRTLESQLETLRRVFNDCLDYCKRKYQERKGSGEKSNIETDIAEFRKELGKRRDEQISTDDGPRWLAHVSERAIRGVCSRVERAYALFFKRLKAKRGKAGFPRFKRRGELTSLLFTDASGWQLRDVSRRLECEGKKVTIRNRYRVTIFGVVKDKKPSGIRTTVHREIVGDVKGACVKRDVDGKWYIVVTATYRSAVAPTKNGQAIGLDMGLRHYATDSNGQHEPNPRLATSHQIRLRELSRSVSRKWEAAKIVAKKNGGRPKKSRRYKAISRKKSLLHVRVRNLRKEHRYKLAARLIHENGLICVEKLNIKGMLRHGKLARSIQDAAWGSFLNVLEHKAKKAGVQFVEVEASGSSQVCPQCGGSVPKKGFNGLKVRIHDCPHCGQCTIDRDHAAAWVILNRHVLGRDSVWIHDGVGTTQTAVQAKANEHPRRLQVAQASGDAGAGQRQEGCCENSQPQSHSRAVRCKHRPKKSSQGTLSQKSQQVIPGMEDAGGAPAQDSGSLK